MHEPGELQMFRAAAEHSWVAAATWVAVAVEGNRGHVPLESPVGCRREEVVVTVARARCVLVAWMAVLAANGWGLLEGMVVASVARRWLLLRLAPPPPAYLPRSGGLQLLRKLLPSHG